MVEKDQRIEQKIFFIFIIAGHGLKQNTLGKIKMFMQSYKHVVYFFGFKLFSISEFKSFSNSRASYWLVPYSTCKSKHFSHKVVFSKFKLCY